MPVPTRLDGAYREAAWRRLAEEQFDVLVIGGGVTGAGVALDAATRGLRVALVEQRDFASGTSSRSSKLFHGGVRYLEQMNFALVREALRDRPGAADEPMPDPEGWAAEVDVLLGDGTKARDTLGWQPTVGFDELVRIMVDADIAVLGDQLAGKVTRYSHET